MRHCIRVFLYCVWWQTSYKIEVLPEYQNIKPCRVISFNQIKNAEQINHKRPNIININNDEIKIDLGKSTDIAGELSVLSLDMATDDLKRGLIDVLVTAPINKKNIQTDKFKFPGHTEYLANKFNAKDYL